MSAKEPRFPGETLTVVIRDPGPLIHMNEPVALRTVRLTLTPEQREQLALRWTGSRGGTDIFEEISQVIAEPAEVLP